MPTTDPGKQGFLDAVSYAATLSTLELIYLMKAVRKTKAEEEWPDVVRKIRDAEREQMASARHKMSLRARRVKAGAGSRAVAGPIKAERVLALKRLVARYR